MLIGRTLKCKIVNNIYYTFYKLEKEYKTNKNKIYLFEFECGKAYPHTYNIIYDLIII